MSESKVSNNGELLRMFMQWLEKRFDKQKDVVENRRFNRAENIYMHQAETNSEKLKYYASQLLSGGRMGTIKLIEYITELTNIGLVDSALLRKLEEVYKNANNDEKKIVQWMKKHPATWAYLSYYLTIALIGTITWGGVKINNYVKGKEKEKKEIVVNPESEKNESEEIVRKNVELFEKTRSKMKFSLAFGENYYPYVYFCGKAWTTGHGLTVLYGADGTAKKVTKNTKPVTLEESDVYKGRYLTREVLPDVKNLVKVPLDEKTLLAVCVLRYCIGHKNFAESNFLKQLNSGKKGAELAKTLTGWRQQSGVLQRCYFFAALMCDKITFDDLLDLRAEGCYNLKLTDIVVCSDGTPKTDEKNFYEWDFTKIQKNLETAKQSRSVKLVISPAAKGKKNRTVVVNCQLVKQIVPDYIWEEVSGKKKTEQGKIDKKTAFANGEILIQNKTFDMTPLFVSSDKEYDV